MSTHHHVTIGLSEDHQRVTISGDVDALRKDRRVKMSLKRMDPSFDEEDMSIAVGNNDITELLLSLHEALASRGYSDTNDEDSGTLLDDFYTQEKAFREFSEKALRIRNNNCDPKDFQSFSDSLTIHLPGRQLYPLQLLSAYHMAFSQNSANFSVPGAGKTTIVYGAFAYLHSLPPNNQKHVDALVVVGPLSSFQPWEDEFYSCFRRLPTVTRLDGSMGLAEKKNYLIAGNHSDLTLISYGSIASLELYLKDFLNNVRTMVVLDEAHKVKNTQGGSTATAALSIARFAAARIVLTGTPAPNGYEDLYNLFEFIWPQRNIVRFQVNQLADMSKNERDTRIPRLLSYLEPYYLRIRKSDLNLPPVNNMPLQLVEMSPLQKRIYNELEYLSLEALLESDLGEEATFNSAFAKSIRLMQATGNPAALLTAEKNPDSDFMLTPSLREAIIEFSREEVPAKFRAALEIVKHHINLGDKVIVWATFIPTLQALGSYFAHNGISAELLYGGTPTGGADDEDDGQAWTRELIIRRFNDSSSSLKVVIANPAAVAESISLHHACHVALYFERSFNAAQYLQSRDRIHRYGLTQGTITTYYKLACRNTIDEVIDERLALKERRLLRIVESSEIPLFDNAKEGTGLEDIKALMRDYVRRTNKI